MYKFKILVVAAITAFSFSTVQAAEIIYKWKDSKGNIKYTQSKPPAGIDYTTIKNRSSKASTPPSVTAKKSEAPVNEQDKIIAAQNVEKNRVDALNAERAAKNCTISKNNLEALERTTRIQVEEDGERRMLTDEERANRLKEAQENIAKYCK
ncbi:MAG: DUF4124 domain-containing protein [Gammaproteobacteria bacterium]|nr:DUF4124 domain-containing protein [Gammaproteobacteria bacterium]